MASKPGCLNILHVCVSCVWSSLVGTFVWLTNHYYHTKQLTSMHNSKTYKTCNIRPTSISICNSFWYTSFYFCNCSSCLASSLFPSMSPYSSFASSSVCPLPFTLCRAFFDAVCWHAIKLDASIITNWQNNINYNNNKPINEQLLVYLFQVCNYFWLYSNPTTTTTNESKSLLLFFSCYQ